MEYYKENILIKGFLTDKFRISVIFYPPFRCREEIKGERIKKDYYLRRRAVRTSEYCQIIKLILGFTITMDKRPQMEDQFEEECDISTVHVIIKKKLKTLLCII